MRAATAIQTHSATVLAKAEAKDLDGAKAAFGELKANGCVMCHKALREQKQAVCEQRPTSMRSTGR